MIRRRSRDIRDIWRSQPACDWVEEGEVGSEGEGKLEEREDIVEMVDTLRDVVRQLWLGYEEDKEGKMEEWSFYMR